VGRVEGLERLGGNGALPLGGVRAPAGVWGLGTLRPGVNSRAHTVPLDHWGQAGATLNEALMYCLIPYTATMVLSH